MDILLVDDHDATRQEIASLIEEHDDLHVVAQAGDGETGVRLAKELHPDVIVMDIAMPGMNGIAATTALRTHDPNVRVVTLSNHTGKHLVESVLRAGASGYVRKDRSYEELVPAIRAVAGGEQYIGEHIDK
jgi:DNA-binding NarL/FixJ family response regulator